MNKLLLVLISILLAVGGCDIFKDEKSESKTTSKTEVKQESDNESQASELSKKEEELKKKELELKEEELRIKEEQLQKKKKSERTSYGVPGDYPEGSTRYLTYADIAGKSKWELSVMRNEIFARHGYIFRKNMAIRDHFMRQSWYEPRYYNVEHLLTDIERYNVEFIKSFE